MTISLSRRSKRANDSYYHTLAKRHGPPILKIIFHHGFDNPFVPMDVDPDDPVKIVTFSSWNDVSSGEGFVGSPNTPEIARAGSLTAVFLPSLSEQALRLSALYTLERSVG